MIVVTAMCVMNAESIGKALGGHKVGSNWMAHCPAHDDREPSLSIRNADGKVLVRCHAGCEQVRVIATLRHLGLWKPNSGSRDPSGRQLQKHQIGREDDKPAGYAMRIWESAATSDDTLVGTYLRSRGLTIPPPQNLRFHPGLKHPSGNIWPAMVALVTRGSDDLPMAIHRTFLTRNGTGKAPVAPQKMMLGPCRGGAVRLAPMTGELMVGEGIETCLAAMQVTGRPAWAALSTSGLRSLDLPDDAREIVVLADGDDPGEAAAQACALRWNREGRQVRIARPPRGLDFNDLLVGLTSSNTGDGE